MRVRAHATSSAASSRPYSRESLLALCVDQLGASVKALMAAEPETGRSNSSTSARQAHTEATTIQPAAAEKGSHTGTDTSRTPHPTRRRRHGVATHSCATAAHTTTNSASPHRRRPTRNGSVPPCIGATTAASVKTMHIIALTMLYLTLLNKCRDGGSDDDDAVSLKTRDGGGGGSSECCRRTRRRPCHRSSRVSGGSYSARTCASRGARPSFTEAAAAASSSLCDNNTKDTRRINGKERQEAEDGVWAAGGTARHESDELRYTARQLRRVAPALAAMLYSRHSMLRGLGLYAITLSIDMAPVKDDDLLPLMSILLVRMYEEQRPPMETNRAVLLQVVFSAEMMWRWFMKRLLAHMSLEKVSEYIFYWVDDWVHAHRQGKAMKQPTLDSLEEGARAMRGGGETRGGSRRRACSHDGMSGGRPHDDDGNSRVLVGSGVSNSSMVGKGQTSPEGVMGHDGQSLHVRTPLHQADPYTNDKQATPTPTPTPIQISSKESLTHESSNRTTAKDHSSCRADTERSSYTPGRSARGCHPRGTTGVWVQPTSATPHRP